MSSLLRTLGQAASVGGATLHGYGLDQRQKVADVLASRKQKQDEDRDAVLNALSRSQTTENVAQADKLKNPQPKILGHQISSDGTPYDILEGPDKLPLWRKATIEGQAPPGVTPPTPPPATTGPTGATGATGPTTTPTPPVKAPAAPVTFGTRKEQSTIPGTPEWKAAQTAGAQIHASVAEDMAGLAKRKAAITDNEARMKEIDAALADLDTHQSAVGIDLSKGGLARGIGAVPGLSKVGEILTQKADTAGVGTRNTLQNVGSMVIHDRSGGAVSGPEFQRLGFVPDASYDYAANKKKLEGLKRFAQIETDELRKGLPSGEGAASVPASHETEASWAAKNPPHPGEAFDAYHARYLKSQGSP